MVKRTIVKGRLNVKGNKRERNQEMKEEEKFEFKLPENSIVKVPTATFKPQSNMG